MARRNVLNWIRMRRAAKAPTNAITANVIDVRNVNNLLAPLNVPSLSAPRLGVYPGHITHHTEIDRWP